MIDARLLPVALAALFVSADALASPELARSRNCVACHHAERRMIGPSYTAIAQKYANDNSAVRVLSERVLAGGSGSFGPMPMPAQSGLSQEEVETLVRWILTHK